MRLPLGVFWIGECRAAVTAFQPEEDTQLDCCNFGYAQGRCPRFPGGSSADAVRFTKQAAGAMFILERNHVPVRFGPLTAIETGSILERQSQAWNST